MGHPPALLALLRTAFLLIFFSSSLDYVYAERNGTYLLSLPAELHGGTTEKFCITFFDIREDVNIIFVIHNEDNSWNFNKRDLYAKGECRCTNIEVPEVYVEGFYILTVWGFKENQQLLFSQTKDNVKIVNNNTITFIQTDKYLYVPGQTVKFRILTTNINLRSKAGMISEVAVINPYGIRIKKWSDVANMQGLMSFEFLIAPQPLLGQWKIRVTDGIKKTEADFEVQKYVLPRFEVSIEAPSYLLLNSPEITVKVCANHPQGKEIHGQLKSKVCIYTSAEEDDGRPCANYTAEICGCHNFTIDSKSIGLSLRKYSLKNAYLEVFASVHDSESRLSVNSTVYGPEIKSEHVIIDLESSEYSFKPGFLYYGKAIVYKHDYKVAPGEMVEISAIDYVNDIRLSKNFTSDRNGRITFTINQFDSRTEQFFIEARSINGTLTSNDDHHMMYTPISQKVVKQWYSPGKKYLKILPLDNVKSCSENSNVKLLYTGVQREKITLYYLIMSKSQIVANGQMSYRIDRRHEYTKKAPPNVLNTIINNLSSIPEQPESLPEHIPNQVPTPTSATYLHLTNMTDPKPLAAESNVVVENEEEKKKKKKRKMKKSRERKPRATKEVFIAELNMNLRIIPEMSPLSYLTIYLLNDDGELISDYLEITVQTCFKNQVSFKIPEEKMYVGDVINFELSGSMKSQCALNLVDLSTFPGWSSWITKEQVFEKLKEYHYQYDEETPLPDKHCQDQLLEEQHGIVSRGTGYRGRRSTAVFSSKYVDAIYAFQVSGVVLLTDVLMESRPCSWIDPLPSSSESSDNLWEEFYHVPESTTEAEVKIEDTFLPEERYGILDYFPEPLLWKEQEIKTNGSVIISTKVPFPANEWTGNIFCASAVDGLGLLSIPLVSIFQPFSVSYVVPYTCIAGERIPVSITVASNVKSCLSIQLYVEKQRIFNNESQMIEGPELCICNEEFVTSEVFLENLVPGSINLTVLAVVIETPIRKCTTDTMEKEYFGKTDVSNAIIEVMAQGFHHEIIQSDYVCPRENEGGVYRSTVTSEIPDDIIPGSVKAEVFMFGNMLWPGITKLDDWIQDPITNGEGNILSVAAVICVMDYLNAVGFVSFAIESQAMKMMERGYQQQMNYIHGDGSYSIFGNQDKEGSELLTAFSVQVLVKARSYVYIDDRNLQKSIAWLRSRQDDDGCFLDEGEKMKKSKYQKKTEKLTAIHTAKVMISLLELGTPQYDPIVDMGFKCLRSHEAEDLYMIALYGYAFSLYGHDEQETDKYRRELETKSFSDVEYKYWMSSDNRREDSAITSLDVETTAYALLALLGNEAVSSWQDLKPIVHWLTKQRKPLKGFVASRDSMIAFQAITNYGLMWSQRQESTDFQVKIFDGAQLEGTYKFTQDSQFDLLTYTTEKFKEHIRIEADGYGCGIIQTSLSYNMHTVSRVQSFQLKVQVHHDNNKCAEREINICCRYTGTDEKTNVVIMELKMVTGWIPQQILDPKHLKDIGVKKHEMTEDHVYLYFEKMNQTNKCFTIKLEQVLRVLAQPATIFVYDYYDKTEVGYAQYKLATKCGTKEELPDVSEEEYKKAIGQARQPHRMPEMLHAMFASNGGMEVTTTTLSELEFGPIKTPAPVDPTAINRTIKDTVTSSTIQCPKCLTKVPDEYVESFCQADEVYKIASGKEKENEKDLLKIIADLRPLKKITIDKHVVPVLGDSCNCPPLKEKGRYVLLRRRRRRQLQEMDRMTIDNEIVIFPMTPTVEKRMRQLAKSCIR